MQTAVTIENLFQHVAGRRVLDGVSLTVMGGESFALLGPNSAGKSMLLRLLAGLDGPSSGRIEVLGRELGQLDAAGLDRLRQGMGMVFQGGSLLNGLTVLENILLPLRGAAIDWDEMQRKARLIMMQLRLDGLENFRPGELSGGLLRRIEIARALVREPRLLLLDEVMDGLDRGAMVEILELVRDYKARHEMTVIYTSHLLEYAMDIADRVALLQGGRLLFLGSPEQLQEAAVEDQELRYIVDGQL